MKEAQYYTLLDEKRVRCELCPHYCVIQNGNYGICGVRKNVNNILFSEVYGKPVSIHSDPVEKKPLYHFYPGYQVLSLGTYGCNLKCKFCQNCDISQVRLPENNMLPEKLPEEVIEMAMLKNKNIGLAYTYNEPLVFYEYMIDLARLAKRRGLKNIMVSNGFINPEPLNELIELIDAFNIDLKSFNNSFYQKYTKSSISPVLETISAISHSNKHMELTFLPIPGLNDDLEEFEKMTDWIVNNCGRSTVLHISRYHPAYQIQIPPTPLKTLDHLYYLAKQKLDYVYLGNILGPEGKDTICPGCHTLLISRSGYYSTMEGLSSSGKCKNCGEIIINHISI